MWGYRGKLFQEEKTVSAKFQVLEQICHVSETKRRPEGLTYTREGKIEADEQGTWAASTGL